MISAVTEARRGFRAGLESLHQDSGNHPWRPPTSGFNSVGTSNIVFAAQH
jgi:hypothetical protein